jgi:hypothetical protein
MTAYTDVTGHQVDTYFLGRQIEQQATQSATTTDDNAGR